MMGRFKPEPSGSFSKADARKEDARRVWHAAARIYGSGPAVDEVQVNKLFETWWRRNARSN